MSDDTKGPMTAEQFRNLLDSHKRMLTKMEDLHKDLEEAMSKPDSEVNLDFKKRLLYLFYFQGNCLFVYTY